MLTINEENILKIKVKAHETELKNRDTKFEELEAKMDRLAQKIGLD